MNGSAALIAEEYNLPGSGPAPSSSNDPNGSADGNADKLAKSDSNERSAGRTKKGIQCRVSSRPFIMYDCRH